MSIDERKRHALYERLDEVLDGEHADALMELLPPVGWADVATKRDLEALEQRMDLRFDAMGARFDALDPRFEASDARFDAKLANLGSALRTEMRSQTWTIVVSIVIALVISEIVSRVG
jgi:hypothetical protein